VIANDPTKSIKFCALQSRAAEPLFAEFGLTREEALTSIVFIEGDKHYQRSDAAIRIAQHLSWPFPAMGAFLLVPRILRDAVYGCVSVNRYRVFGQSDACLPPTASIMRRFLDADEYKEAQAAESRARRLERQQQKACSGTGGEGEGAAKAEAVDAASVAKEA